MAITAQQILDKARDIMADVGGSGGFRLDDVIGLTYVSDAVQDIWTRRDIALQANGTRLGIPPLATLAAILTGFEDRFLEPLAHFVAARAYQHDTDDQQSAALASRNMGIYRATS